MGLIGCAYVAGDFPLVLLNIAWAGIALSAILFPERAPSSASIEGVTRCVTPARGIEFLPAREPDDDSSPRLAATGVGPNATIGLGR
jgi:hypothetical protein